MEGDVLRKWTRSDSAFFDGLGMTTSPEFSKWEVRGPSDVGIDGEVRFSYVVCFEMEQLAGILWRGESKYQLTSTCVRDLGTAISQ